MRPGEKSSRDGTNPDFHRWFGRTPIRQLWAIAEGFIPSQSVCRPGFGFPRDRLMSTIAHAEG